MAELRVPPGRAGRLWLIRRLHTARRGVDLLDRRLRILLTEQERLRLLAERTEAEWHAAADVAQRWLLRAALLGQQREIRLSTPAAPAEVHLDWAAVMGVRYPARARVESPAPPDRLPGTAALAEAAAAYRAAAQAAATHAATDSARRLVEREVVETRRRLHAIADRWVPRLTSALQGLEQRLEEDERAETVRLRWVVGQGSGSR